MNETDSTSSNSRALSKTQVPSNTLGRYELLHKFASGGMAEVYAARAIGARGFEKLVAIKRMLPTLAEDPKFVAMFMDEAKLSSSIASPYVVQTLDLGEAEDGSLYIVMDLVMGRSLFQLLRSTARAESRLDLDLVTELIRQAALGLHDAHEARSVNGTPLGLVHRDVSPQNILVGLDGRVRITDFGIASAIDRMTHTETGEIKGKMSYCSPEQVAGEGIDRRSDVFSLGVVAWECLTMARLFKKETPAGTVRALLFDDIEPPHKVAAHVPTHLSAVVMTALDRDPNNRFSTALEFAEAIQAAAGNGRGQARVSTFVRDVAGDEIRELKEAIHSASVSTPIPLSEQTEPSISLPVSGGKTWAFRIAVLLLMSAAAVGSYWLASPAAPPERSASSTNAAAEEDSERSPASDGEESGRSRELDLREPVGSAATTNADPLTAEGPLVVESTDDAARVAEPSPEREPHPATTRRRVAEGMRASMSALRGTAAVERPAEALPSMVEVAPSIGSIERESGPDSVPAASREDSEDRPRGATREERRGANGALILR